MRGNGALPAGETCSSSAGAICRELAGWPSGPWLLPTVTSVTHELLWVPARLEENDLNFFLLLVLFCFVFSPFWGYSEWAGPLGETQLPLLASF